MKPVITKQPGTKKILIEEYGYDDLTDLVNNIITADHPKREDLVKFFTNVLWNTDVGVSQLLMFNSTKYTYPELPNIGDFGYISTGQLWLPDHALKALISTDIIKEEKLMPVIVSGIRSLASNYPIEVSYVIDPTDMSVDRSTCRIDMFAPAKDEFGIRQILLNKCNIEL